MRSCNISSVGQERGSSPASRGNGSNRCCSLLGLTTCCKYVFLQKCDQSLLDLLLLLLHICSVFLVTSLCWLICLMFRRSAYVIWHLLLWLFLFNCWSPPWSFYNRLNKLLFAGSSSCFSSVVPLVVLLLMIQSYIHLFVDLINL